MPGLDLGIDMGTSQVIIALPGRGVVLKEPSVIAVDKADGHIIACGSEAYDMLGRTPDSILAVRPLSKGVISDYDYAERMMRYFVRKVCAFKMIKPRAAVSLPASVTEVEQRSAVEAVTASGIRKVVLIDEAVAAALGAGLDLSQPKGNMVVDIGAGTTDIAVCRDGSVVGYTMVTLAGDEITEALMRALLVDFRTAEAIKRDLWNGADLHYTDILGVENTTSYAAVYEVIQEPMRRLAEAIAAQVSSVNGGAPSAVFLAGGGSRLRELREEVAQCLGMEERRVSMAGNHYAKSAFSEELDLERPEYATPLGIAISAGLGLLNDSYLVMLNGQPAKLFRSGTLTLRDILLMNGYTYEEILGKSGKSLSVTLDGRRVVLRGEPAAPAVLRLNGEDAPVSAMVHAGDQISFIPARSGADAARTLAELLGRPVRALVNNREAPADTQLKQGDVILTLESPASVAEAAAEPAAPYVSLRTLDIVLNEKPLHLDGKEDGAPYYLMDLLKFSGLDFDHLEQPVRLEVNGAECGFRQVLKDGDSVTIACV